MPVEDTRGVRGSRPTKRNILLLIAVGGLAILAIVTAYRLGTTRQSPSVIDSQVASSISAEVIYEKSSPAVFTIHLMNDKHVECSHGSGFFVSDEYVPTKYQVLPTVARLATRVPFEDARFSDFSVAYGLTNYHVIESAVFGEASIRGEKIGVIVDVLAEDVECDVALVSIMVPKNISRSTLTLSHVAPKVGATVFAIGSPRKLENSLSQGLISAIRPNEPLSLQFTAPISPGSSGGPLLNDRAEVIGIASASVRGGQNLNFAVTADELRHVLQRTHKHRPLWRGVSVAQEKSLLLEQAIEIAAANNHLSKFVRLIPRLEYGTILFSKEEAMSATKELAAATGVPVTSQIVLRKTAAYLTGEIAYEHFSDSVVDLVKDSERSRYADQNDDFRTAVTEFEKVRSLDSTFSPALDGLFNCYFQAGKSAQSLAIAELLAAQVPRSADVHFSIAMLLADVGDIQGEIAALKTVLSLDPFHYSAANSLADCYMGLEDYEKAIEAYQQAISICQIHPVLESNHADAYFNLSAALHDSGKFRAAYDALRKAKELYEGISQVDGARACEHNMKLIEPLIRNR